MKIFLGSSAWAKTTNIMDKVQLYFQKLKEKPAYRYLFSMSDEESHSESEFYFIVLFLRIAKKNNNE